MRLHRTRNQATLLQLQRERKDYYDQLEATQKGPLDVTPWLSWLCRMQ